MTNNLKRRLLEHKFGKGDFYSFTKRYYVFYLVYFEEFTEISEAIDRETKLKIWTRARKIELIDDFNPEWKFLNDEV